MSPPISMRPPFVETITDDEYFFRKIFNKFLKNLAKIQTSFKNF